MLIKFQTIPMHRAYFQIMYYVHKFNITVETFNQRKKKLLLPVIWETDNRRYVV